MDIVKGNIEAENMSIHESEEITDYDGYEDVLYMYDTPETGLFESTTIIPGLEFASIETLKKELNEQYGIVKFEEDDHDEFEEGPRLTDSIGKSNLDLLICKEGAYGWNEINHEYEYYGEFDLQKTFRVKRVEILEHRVAAKGDTLALIEKGHYSIVDEEVKTINAHFKIEMFTIEQRYTGELITIPNSPGVFRVYERDLAFIGFIDEKKFD
ncbi:MULTISPECIES: hypothetical protein [Paenibacillaceae]|uniref:hypothetical protein n=1 Tax=Paenibacillaceae TaxID=186822 RepID=UPI0002A4EB0E|nr:MULTISPECIES: hypothetical protein [Brevibacillus]ELK41164.1 hypothetical protein D478_15275 [Brevibacillus agri BAB-2500]MBE5394929.1 hypothetical protein [Brevibacillus borstelensis]MCG5252937.1 hypothetical protein [Brevibacillus agri]MCM3472214.1 hypothetical protein [Brevibacillus borstelensis]MCM3624345.1 hypothetical protein [Brevibacillus borstelensis]